MSDPNTMEDRTQLAVSEQGTEDREYIRDELQLKELQDAYRLGVAVALAKELPAAPEGIRRTNTYGTGDVDPDGALRASILALRDDHGGRPYALLQRLAEAGLRDIAAYLNEGRPIRQYLIALFPKAEEPK
jgi:hypothetical protein